LIDLKRGFECRFVRFEIFVDSYLFRILA